MVTGGHSEDGADVLTDAGGSLRIEVRAIPTAPRTAPGAPIRRRCRFLARGEELADAARWAKEVAAEAVGNGLQGIGRGAGPVDVLGIARAMPDRDEAGSHDARTRRCPVGRG